MLHDFCPLKQGQGGDDERMMTKIHKERTDEGRCARDSPQERVCMWVCVCLVRLAEGGNRGQGHVALQTGGMCRGKSRAQIRDAPLRSSEVFADR